MVKSKVRDSRLFLDLWPHSIFLIDSTRRMDVSEGNLLKKITVY